MTRPKYELRRLDGMLEGTIFQVRRPSKGDKIGALLAQFDDYDGTHIFLHGRRITSPNQTSLTEAIHSQAPELRTTYQCDICGKVVTFFKHWVCLVCEKSICDNHSDHRQQEHGF